MVAEDDSEAEAAATKLMAVLSDPEAKASREVVTVVASEEEVHNSKVVMKVAEDSEEAAVASDVEEAQVVAVAEAVAEEEQLARRGSPRITPSLTRTCFSTGTRLVSRTSVSTQINFIPK